MAWEPWLCNSEIEEEETYNPDDPRLLVNALRDDENEEKAQQWVRWLIDPPPSD